MIIRRCCCFFIASHVKFNRMNLKMLITFSFLIPTFFSFAQSPRPLLWEMNRCDVNTALVWSYPEGIEEHAYWSENNDYLAFFCDGRWVKLNLNEVFLVPADWLDMTIGSDDTEILDSVSPEELERYKSITKYGDRKISTTAGVTLELRQDGFSTRFIRKEGKKKEKVLWQTSLENCYSLSLSPDEKFVAFISETNGLMVYCMNESDYKEKLPEAVLEMNSAINNMNPKDVSKAEVSLSKAMALDSNLSEPYYWQAYIELYRKNDLLAIQNLEKALSIDPNNSGYYYTLYNLYNSGENKNAELAIQNLKEYIRTRPNDCHGYYDLGILYKEMGKIDLACENLKTASKLHSNRAKKLIAELCKE